MGEFPVSKGEKSKLCSQLFDFCPSVQKIVKNKHDRQTTMAPDFYRPTAAAAAATSANPTPNRCSHLPPAPVTPTPPLLASHRYPLT